jgi:putative FmdB family regulatory protein
MPIFEYRCSECAHLEEVLQKHSDPAPDVCPKCGKQHTMHKEISMTSFQLKGGGWYKDLYSSSSGKSETTTTSTEKKTESSSTAPATTAPSTTTASASSSPPSSPASPSGAKAA